MSRRLLVHQNLSAKHLVLDCAKIHSSLGLFVKLDTARTLKVLDILVVRAAYT